jgi:flagellar hook-associated protein 2
MTTPVSYLPTSLDPSGLDDTAIISALVAEQQVPITTLQTQESNLQTQVSDLGTLSSDVNALNSATQNLAASGVVSNQVTSSNSSFTATAGTGAAAGTYNVQITQLATAASAISQAFAGPDAPVTVGSSPPLVITVQGVQYTVNVNNGDSLSTVAQEINASGAPVTALVLSNGTNSYLTLTDEQTGFPAGNPTGDLYVQTNNTNLNLTITNSKDAQLTVDGVPGISSSSNTVSDVIPGVTLNLNSTEASPEALTIGASASGTAANLQAFVSAYNQLSSDLAAQLDVAPTSSSSTPPPLANDSGTEALQQQLQQLLTTTVSGVNLASIGVLDTTGSGQLSIDQTQLASALASNPQGINTLFSQLTTGLGAAVTNLTTEFTAPISGALTGEQQNRDTQIANLGTQVTTAQAQLATFQTNLTQQFANMESVISGFKSVQSFLTDQEASIAAESGLGNS